MALVLRPNENQVFTIPNNPGTGQKDATVPLGPSMHTGTAAYAVLLLALAGVAPGIKTLWDYWFTIHDYNHGFLVAAICVAWLWRLYPVVRRSAASPGWRWFPGLLGVLLLWYVLWQSFSDIGQQMLLPIVVWLATASAVGASAARSLIEPLAYFYFAIPFWDYFLPILQRITVFGAEWSMRLVGVPVNVYGNKVAVPEGTFEVIYSCSGLSYLVVSLALAYLIGAIDRIPWRNRCLFLGVTAALAILANWIRVFIVIYAGHITGMQHYFVVDSHLGLGKAVFAAVLIAIVWLATFFPRQSGGVVQKTLGGGASGNDSPLSLGNMVSVAATLGLFLFIAVRALAMPSTDSSVRIAELPIETGEFQGPLPTSSSWQPEFPGASDARRFAYADKLNRVEVYLATYGVQHQLDKELVFYGNNLFAPGKWQLLALPDLGNTLEAVAGQELEFVETLDANGRRWLVGQAYVVGGRVTSSGLAAQLLYGFSTIRAPAASGVIAAAAQCQQDCKQATALLRRFWTANRRALVNAVPARVS